MSSWVASLPGAWLAGWQGWLLMQQTLRGPGVWLAGFQALPAWVACTELLQLASADSSHASSQPLLPQAVLELGPPGSWQALTVLTLHASAGSLACQLTAPSLQAVSELGGPGGWQALPAWVALTVLRREVRLTKEQEGRMLKISFSLLPEQVWPVCAHATHSPCERHSTEQGGQIPRVPLLLRQVQLGVLPWAVYNPGCNTSAGLTLYLQNSNELIREPKAPTICHIENIPGFR